MCNPTTALVVASVASAGLQYQQAKQQQKNAYAQQKRQNEIARKNAIQRYASEQLRIRQEVEKSKDNKILVKDAVISSGEMFMVLMAFMSG